MVRCTHNMLNLRISLWRGDKAQSRTVCTDGEKQQYWESLALVVPFDFWKKSYSSGNCTAQTLSKIQQPVKICVLPQILVCKDNPWIYNICTCVSVEIIAFSLARMCVCTHPCLGFFIFKAPCLADLNTGRVNLMQLLSRGCCLPTS